MRLLSRVYQTTLVGFLTLVATVRVSPGFDNNAHLALSQRAIGTSAIDSRLRTNLPFEFPDGVLQVVEAGKTPIALIREGVLLEDSIGGVFGLSLRVKNHFHNPRLSWDQAGLWPPGFSGPIGYSSVVWSQLQNQGNLGSKSWHQARDAYFTALTSTSQFERKKWYAATFRLLGHAVHHIQDAAVPSHTRNDGHLGLLGRFPDKDLFHMFAERSEVLALINNPNALPGLALGESFLSNQPSPDSRYPVPIARLFDTTAGDIGGAALGNGSGIGIAEYSHANFFSDDTIRSATFPYPGLSNLEARAPEFDPSTGDKNVYLFFKPNLGAETNYRLAQASSLRNITLANQPTPIVLDYKVLWDYGLKLFPRAIGYSAGLIDYFFRGRITGYFNGVTQIPFSQRPTSIGFSDVSITDTTGNEQVGPGTLRLVLIKRDVSNAGPETFPDILVSQPTSVSGNPSFSFGSLPFPTTPLPENGPHPVQSTEYHAFIVYKGTLGQEIDNTVVAGGGSCSYGGAKTLAFVHVREGGYPEDHAWITQGWHSC